MTRPSRNVRHTHAGRSRLLPPLPVRNSITIPIPIPSQNSSDANIFTQQIKSDLGIDKAREKGRFLISYVKHFIVGRHEFTRYVRSIASLAASRSLRRLPLLSIALSIQSFTVVSSFFMPTSLFYQYFIRCPLSFRPHSRSRAPFLADPHRGL